MIIYLRKTCKESLMLFGLLYESDIEITHAWLDDEDCKHSLPGHLTERQVPCLVDGPTTVIGEKAISDYLIFKGL